MPVSTPSGTGSAPRVLSLALRLGALRRTRTATPSSPWQSARSAAGRNRAKVPANAAEHESTYDRSRRHRAAPSVAHSLPGPEPTAACARAVVIHSGRGAGDRGARTAAGIVSGNVTVIAPCSSGSRRTLMIVMPTSSPPGRTAPRGPPESRRRRRPVRDRRRRDGARRRPRHSRRGRSRCSRRRSGPLAAPPPDAWLPRRFVGWHTPGLCPGVVNRKVPVRKPQRVTRGRFVAHARRAPRTPADRDDSAGCPPTPRGSGRGRLPGRRSVAASGGRAATRARCRAR